MLPSLKSCAYLLNIVCVIAIAGCGKKQPPRQVPPVVPTAPAPAPPPTDKPEEEPALDEYARFQSMSAEALDRLSLLREIHFDFDRSEIRDDARPVLAHNAGVLRQFDFLRVTVEGHCDERGTVEYNLALGERRARATYDYLRSARCAPRPVAHRLLR